MNKLPNCRIEGNVLAELRQRNLAGQDSSFQPPECHSNVHRHGSLRRTARAWHPRIGKRCGRYCASSRYIIVESCITSTPSTPESRSSSGGRRGLSYGRAKVGVCMSRWAVIECVEVWRQQRQLHVSFVGAEARHAIRALACGVVQQQQTPL